MQDREWFTIRTKVHKEFQAAQQFKNQGYAVYLPVTRRRRRHARRDDTVTRPYFPGYLFLHLAPLERQWTTIGSTIGAIGPVHFGEQYPSVPEGIISQLQSQEDAEGVIIPFNTVLPHLTPGTAVVVDMEEFEGLKGIFMEMRGADRALILLELLRRQVATMVPVEHIKTV